MEKNNGCAKIMAFGGCLCSIAILLFVVFCLRSVVNWVKGFGHTEYQPPAAFQDTLDRYKNDSVDLRFDLPEGMEFVSEGKDTDLENLTGIHQEMKAQNNFGQTLVIVYDLAALDAFQQSLNGTETTGDIVPFSLDTTEEQTLSYMLDGITQEFGGDAWQKSDSEYIDFAGKEYLSATWRIGMESEGGEQYILYIRGYACRKDDLMVYVMISAHGSTIEETEQRLEQISGCYRKA